MYITKSNIAFPALSSCSFCELYCAKISVRGRFLCHILEWPYPFQWPVNYLALSNIGFRPHKSINENCCKVYIMREMLYENGVNTACAFTGNIFWKRSKYCDMPQLQDLLRLATLCRFSAFLIAGRLTASKN